MLSHLSQPPYHILIASYLLLICMELLFSELGSNCPEVKPEAYSSRSFSGGMGGCGQATRSSLHSLGGFLRNSYSFRKLPATNLAMESADLVGGSSSSARGKNSLRVLLLGPGAIYIGQHMSACMCGGKPRSPSE